MTLNETHDPALRSWLGSANSDRCDFPIQNLPVGMFRLDKAGPFRAGVAIGDQILDLVAAFRSGVLGTDSTGAFEAVGAPTLNGLMALGPAAWSSLRLTLSRALRDGSDCEAKLRRCLVPQRDDILPLHRSL